MIKFEPDYVRDARRIISKYEDALSSAQRFYVFCLNDPWYGVSIVDWEITKESATLCAKEHLARAARVNKQYGDGTFEKPILKIVKCSENKARMVVSGGIVHKGVFYAPKRLNGGDCEWKL